MTDRFEISMAPMEGITDWIYRKTFNECYPESVTKFYTPFLSPGSVKGVGKKERKEISAENNAGIFLIPQILTASPDNFNAAAAAIRDLGYREINLNLGCPSGTVTAKGKGAAMLSNPYRLEKMLDRIFSATDMKISIKTRTGYFSRDEFPELLSVFNRFPVSELIVHPRTGKEGFKNTPDLEMFSLAAEKSRNPVCYNGDIRTAEDFENIRNRFPGISRFMIGRGLIADPFLASEIRGRNRMPGQTGQFHDRLLKAYLEDFKNTDHVLMRMKEIWSYMIAMFPGEEKAYRELRKTGSLEIYRVEAEKILRSVG